MDPLTIGAVAGGISAIGASSLGMLGGLFSNSANAEENHKNRQLALLMQKKQAQWRVADLRKAGLNPVLAANSGLSAGGGHVPSSIPMQNPASGAESLASTLGKLSSDYVKADQTAEQIKLNEQSIASQTSYNDAAAEQQKTQSLLNLAKAESVVNADAREGDKHSDNMQLIKEQVKATQVSSALSEQMRKTEEQRTIVAQAQADYAEVFQDIKMRRAEAELRNINIDSELKQNQISVSRARLVLDKITTNLTKIRTEADIEKIYYEIAALYRRTYNGSLESDLLRWQLGSKVPADREQFLSQASKVTNLLSDIAPLVLMAYPGTRLIGMGWQGLRSLGSIFGKKPIRAGVPHGSYGDRGMTIPRLNGDPWYSNERHW